MPKEYEEQPEEIPGEKKFLLVGTGRCGSSLLSAILAECGASFGMSPIKDWKRSAGAYEHTLLQKAGREFAISRKFAQRADCWWLHRKFRRLHMSNAKRALRRLLAQADYLKSMDLVWLTHPIFKLDYLPKIILVYRVFPEVARSAYLSFGWGYRETEQYYIDVYRTALIQLQVFGGCAIEYGELMNSSETAWADGLSGVTGVDSTQLLKSRQRWVRPIERLPAQLEADAQTTGLFQELRRYKGKVVAPSGNAYAEKH